MSAALNNVEYLQFINLPATATVFELLTALGIGTRVNTNTAGGEAVLVRVPNSSGELIDVLYPYEDSPWAFVQEWQSSRRDFAVGYDDGLFNPNPIFLNINNEPEDAVDPLSVENLVGSDDFVRAMRELFSRRRQSTDSLPRLVEITLFAFDGRNRLKVPTRYKTRVYVEHQ